MQEFKTPEAPGQSAQERLRRREKKALFARLAAARQAEPTVGDVAEATGVEADDVRRELAALRAEQARAAEAAQARRQEVRKAASLGMRRAAWAVASLGLVWLGIAGPNFGTVKPQEAASIAAWHEGQGQQQFRAGRYRAAEKQFQMAAALEPEAAGYRFELGSALLSQQKCAEALPQFQKAAQIMPDRPDYNLEMAEDYRLLKRYKDAAATYRAVINVDAASAPAYEGLGVCLNELDRTSEAEKVLRTAQRLSPENGDIANQLGFALAMQGRWPEAAAQFRQATALDPSREMFRKNLALAEETQKIGIDAMMRKYPDSPFQISAE